MKAADSQVNPTAGKSGSCAGRSPAHRCCSSPLARSREGLCLIRQDGQCLGRSAAYMVIGTSQASAAPAVIKRVSTPGQSRGSRSSTLASISTAPAKDHPTGCISGARSSAGSLKRKRRRSSHRSARVEARAIPVGVVNSPPAADEDLPARGELDNGWRRNTHVTVRVAFVRTRRLWHLH